jgi:hypothetical protein
MPKNGTEPRQFKKNNLTRDETRKNLHGQQGQVYTAGTMKRGRCLDYSKATKAKEDIENARKSKSKTK